VSSFGRRGARGVYCRIATIVLAGAACAPSATAGTIRHDRADSAYTTPASSASYNAVGHFGDFTGGTLFRLNTTDTSSVYVLTAAHIGLPGGGFTINGQNIAVVARTVHPDFDNDTTQNDIAVVQLASAPVGVTPITLYTGNTEATQTATIVGYGATGTGLTGATAGTQGTKRAGTNVVDAYAQTLANGAIVATPDNSASNYKLVTDFDAPAGTVGTFPSAFGSPVPLDTEYQVADKDSGGALILNISGVDYLAGLTSQIVNFNADGTGTGYSDWSVFTRVSSFQTFVAGVVPEPGAVGLMGLCAAVGLLARRRRD